MGDKFKATTIRINSDIYDAMTYFVGLKGRGATLADFINDAIKEKCENERLLRAGGFVLAVNNPQRYFHTLAGALQVSKIVEKAAIELAKLEAGHTVGVGDLAEYLNCRFLRDSAELRHEFNENFCDDNSRFNVKWVKERNNGDHK